MKNEYKLLTIMSIFWIIVFASIFLIINSKEKVTDLSWYRNFYDRNKNFIGEKKEYTPSKCVINKFTEASETIGVPVGTRYRFSYEEGKIKKYKDYDSKILILFTSYGIVNKYGAVEIKIWDEIEISGKYYLQTIFKSYKIRNRSFVYGVDYDLLSDQPTYTNAIVMHRSDIITIPPDQLPEELKNIDYKTKIDEIDKLLEERWNKACGTKVSK